MTRIPTRSGDECDAFERASRRIIPWRRGELRRIKRGFRRRLRRSGRLIEET